MNNADPDTTATVISVAIGAFAVILAAIIAALTAQKRLERTLGSERERLLDQLDSDRSLRDVESLREIFDACLQAVSRARVALRLFMNTGGFQHVQESYVPAMGEAHGAHDRLVLRLGPDEAVVRDYAELLKSLALLRDAVGIAVRIDGMEPAPEEGGREGWLEDREQTRMKARAQEADFGNHWEAFLSSARQLVAARLGNI